MDPKGLLADRPVISDRGFVSHACIVAAIDARDGERRRHLEQAAEATKAYLL
jgi:hypothetical protein